MLELTSGWSSPWPSSSACCCCSPALGAPPVPRPARTPLVQVVHRQPLSRGTAVVVVSVGGRVLVLGTTEHQVRVLAELDPEELELTVDPTWSATSPSSTPSPGRSAARSPRTAAQPAPPRPTLRARRSAGAHRAAARPGAPERVDGPLAGSVLSAADLASGAAPPRPGERRDRPPRSRRGLLAASASAVGSWLAAPPAPAYADPERSGAGARAARRRGHRSVTDRPRRPHRQARARSVTVLIGADPALAAAGDPAELHRRSPRSSWCSA